MLAAHVIVEKIGGVELPERLGSVGWGIVHLARGVVAFAVHRSIKLARRRAPSFDRHSASTSSLIAAAGLAVGGYLMAKERATCPGALGGAKGDSATAAAAGAADRVT